MSQSSVIVIVILLAFFVYITLTRRLTYYADALGLSNTTNSTQQNQGPRIRAFPTPWNPNE